MDESVRENDVDPPKPEGNFENLPSFATYYTREDGRSVDALAVYESFICDECGTLSPYVIGYTLPTMILLPRATRFDYLIKCRRCMRRHIIQRLPLTILLSHLFSPFVVAWWLVVFVQTFYRRPF
jgi:hypothetical protein